MEKPTWSVHVGSFRNLEDAESLRAALTQLHITETEQIWLRTEEVPGLGDWYRVFVGLHKDKEACERDAKIIRETGQVFMARVRHVIPPTP